MLEICLLFFLMSGSSAWFLFYFFLHICTPQNLRVLSARSQRFPITVNTMIAYTETENRSALKTIQKDTHTVQIGRYRKPCKLHCITTFHNCADYWFWPPFIFYFFIISKNIFGSSGTWEVMQAHIQHPGHSTLFCFSARCGADLGLSWSWPGFWNLARLQIFIFSHKVIRLWNYDFKNRFKLFPLSLSVSQQGIFDWTVSVFTLLMVINQLLYFFIKQLEVISDTQLATRLWKLYILSQVFLISQTSPGANLKHISLRH